MSDAPVPFEASVVIAAWPGLDLASLVGDDAATGRARRLNEQRFTLDTADNRLARAGIVVNRVDGQWRVRCGNLGARDFDGEEPAADLLAALGGVGRGAPLVVASRVTRQGRLLPVTAVDEHGVVVVGTIRDEDVSALDGRRVVSRQRYVTIEGTKALVAQVRHGLAAAGMSGRVVKAIPDTTPLGPADPLPWPLEDEPEAGTVVQRAIARSVAKLLAHDPVVRLDLHLEGVHQMRVATRRLRSDLKTFAGLVGPLPERVVDDIRWLATTLGTVRDLDVLRVSLDAAIAQLDPADLRLTNSMLKRLARQREAALSALDNAMTTPRYRELLTVLVDLAERPPLHDEAAGSAVEVLLPRARKSWNRLRESVRAASEKDAPVDAVHAMRLRAKRFRYAVDALVEVDGDAKRHAKVLARLQEVLGEFNDAATAEAWLRSQAAHEDDPKRAFVLGELAMLEHTRMEQRRSAWADAWRPVHRGGVSSWVED